MNSELNGSHENIVFGINMINCYKAEAILVCL